MHFTAFSIKGYLVAIVTISICCSLTTSSSAQKNTPVKSFRDCPDCPEMLVIPAGQFIMGTPAIENAGDSTEQPQHPVKIQRFAVGKFPVTRAEWSAFVLATNRPVTMGCAWSNLPGDSVPWQLNETASWKHMGFEQGDNHPVVCISWDDVMAYIQWLSKTTGGQYRLLTESEWEYAARAGSTTAYPWGNQPNHDYMNYGADSGYTGLIKGKDQWKFTSPVGSFPPNNFGLYDMHGNVLQFVQDCFSPDYRTTPADGTAYTKDNVLHMAGPFADMNGKNACSFRMVRSGDFGDPPKMTRSGYRNWAPGPGISLARYASAALGFRVAKTL